MANKAKIRAAVFASGTGTNAENLIRHAKNHPDFDVPVVICDQPHAAIVEKCKTHDIPCHVVPFQTTRVAHEKDILKELAPYKTDWVFLAGYMRILTTDFLDAFFDTTQGVSRIVNIHPSRLPEFPGRDAYKRAFDAYVPESGVTVHFVDGGIDSGPIILQETFPRLEDDDLKSFTARGFALEYDIYLKAIEILLRNLNTQQSLQEKRA